MRVLIAADGSKHGTAALVSACQILAPREPVADLLCVVPKLDTARAPLQERLERRATRIAERVGGMLAEAGVKCTPYVKSGSATRLLVRLSQDYDVVVVGAKSHAGTGQPGLGPIASRVVEHASASVLVARAGPGDGALRILVPVDGSDGALHALDRLSGMVDLANAEVTLMHVVETHWLRPVDDPDWESGEDEEPGAAPLADPEREFTDEAGQILETARDRVPVRTAVYTLVYHGIPADQILSEANTGDYDLLVLASNGEMDVKHRMLGSVSTRVMWNTPCSVLVVHTGD